MFDIEAAEVGAPAQVEVGGVGTGPPQPECFLGSAGGFGEVFDLDADDGPGHDWWCVVIGPMAPAE